MSKILSASVMIIAALVIATNSHAFDLGKLKEAAKQLQSDLDPNQVKSPDNNKTIPLPTSIPSAQTPVEVKPKTNAAENGCVELVGVNHCFSSANVKYKGEGELQGFFLGSMDGKTASLLAEKINGREESRLTKKGDIRQTSSLCSGRIEPVDSNTAKLLGLFDAYEKLSIKDRSSMIVLFLDCSDEKITSILWVLLDTEFPGYDVISKYALRLKSTVKFAHIDESDGYVVAAIDKYGNKFTRTADPKSGKVYSLKWNKPNGEEIHVGYADTLHVSKMFNPIIEIVNIPNVTLTLKNMISRRIKRSEQEKNKMDAEQKNFKPSL